MPWFELHGLGTGGRSDCLIRPVRVPSVCICLPVASRLPRSVVPPPWPELAHLDVAERPALLPLGTATPPARLAAAGWWRIRHRLGADLRQRRLVTRGWGLRGIECCLFRADFPWPAGLAPGRGHGDLAACQELGAARVDRHLPRPAAWPFYRCCHAVRRCHGDPTWHLSHWLRCRRRTFCKSRPQHDGALHQLGLKAVAGLEVEQVTETGGEGQPAIVVQFEGRQEAYPGDAETENSMAGKR